MAEIDWVLIRKFKPEPIGAVGFVGDDVVAVVAFYDDRDGNKDGKVTWGERIASFLSPVSLKGSAVVEVAMSARVNIDVVTRDPAFAQEATQMWLNFARGLIAEGIYAVYFQAGVKMTGKGIAKVVTGSMVKQIAIRKGFDAVAKKAFGKTVGL